MKLFKNPVFAIVFCLVLILVSTLVSSKSKMEKRYDRVCSQLSENVLDFANEKGLDELAVKARTVSIDQGYDDLIEMFNEKSAGYGKDDTASVDKAIAKYIAFMKDLDRFPARQLSWLVSFR